MVVGAIVVAALLVGLVAPATALAWKPGGHYAVSKKVYADMEPGRIKTAMKNSPDMAFCWGAYGADVGYGQLSTAWEKWAPYADAFHYFKVGTFAKTLLQNALASGRDDQIAYAAGWLTHVCSDMYVHQDIVNPHAGGVFFDNAATIPLHRKIESWADTVMYVKYYGGAESDFNHDTFGDKFHRDMPVGLCNTFSGTVKQVYEKSPSASMAGWVWGTVKSDATLSPSDFEDMTEYCYIGIAYETPSEKADLYLPLGDCERGLSENGISDADVFAAADKGAAMATWLLDCAQRGDYSAFSDTWNLDVGPGQPDKLNSLVVEVTTGAWTLPRINGDGAGTDQLVDFWLGPNWTEDVTVGDQWNIDHFAYNDFEQDDRDLYFVYVGPRAPVQSPSQVGHIGLFNRQDPLLVPPDSTDAWDPRRVKVWCNGVNVVPNAEDIWILNDYWPQATHNWWLRPWRDGSPHLNWSAATQWPARPVPNVVGLNESQASTVFAAAMYYTKGSVVSVDSGVSKGTIVAQSPVAYSKPGYGATVATYVSNGTGPAFSGVSASTLTPLQNTTFSMRAGLYSSGGSMAGRVVRLERATPGGAWSLCTTAACAADGRVAALVRTPKSKTYYRWVYEGTGYTSAVSAAVSVIPKAYVKVPSVVRNAKYTYTVASKVQPIHPLGNTEVLLNRYRYVSGKWRRYSALRMKNVGLGSGGDGSLYRLKTKFPYGGKWKITVTHPTDALNTGYTSAAKIFTVK